MKKTEYEELQRIIKLYEGIQKYNKEVLTQKQVRELVVYIKVCAEKTTPMEISEFIEEVEEDIYSELKRNFEVENIGLILRVDYKKVLDILDNYRIPYIMRERMLKYKEGNGGERIITKEECQGVLKEIDRIATNMIMKKNGKNLLALGLNYITLTKIGVRTIEKLTKEDKDKLFELLLKYEKKEIDL